MIQGMDSSSWEDNPNTIQVPNFQQSWDKGLKFNYLKASQNLYKDKVFDRDWYNCRQTPLTLGAYHFLTWDDPVLQAKFFWETVKNDPGELPLICDFEWWSTIPNNALYYIYTFLEKLKTLTSKPLGIYTAKSFWDQYGNKDPYWTQYYLWLAHYNDTFPTASEIPSPWLECYLQQYTPNGDGIYYGMESKSLDLDWMPEKFWAQFGKGETQDKMLQMRVLPLIGLNVRFIPSTKNNAPLYTLPAASIVSVYDVAGVDSSWVKISPIKEEWCCVQNSNGTYLQKI